jgi:hypothetical protein
MARDGGFGGYGDSPPHGYGSSPDASGGFGPPGGVPPLGGPMTPGSGNEVETTLPLVLSIAATLLCCNPILGLPAIILAIQARNAANMGAADLARKRARTARALAIAAIVLGLAFEIFECLRYFAPSDASH